MKTHTRNNNISEITTALLYGKTKEPLRLIAERASELTDAEEAIVLVPITPDSPTFGVQTLVVAAAVGQYADDVLGQHLPVDGSTSGAVFTSGQPVITSTFRHPIQSFTDRGDRSAIAMPLVSEQQTLGVIILARNALQPPFDTSYLDLARDFAGHAAVALTLSTAREYARQLSVLADRERIARDLNDRVIQRMFTVAIDLQSTVSRVRTPDVANRVVGAIDQLQQVSNDIRLSIFDVKQSSDGQHAFAHRVQEVVSRHTDNTDITATLQTSGSLKIVSPQLADDVEAVLIEALSNAVRHSGADAITVVLTVDNGLTIDVCDNGSGINPDHPRNSGLDNIIHRAKQAGGHCEITSPSTGGTRVSWVAPLLPQ
jgi:signal transduction histidine kinase